MADEKASEQLLELHAAMDEQVNKLANLRRNLLLGKSYSLAYDLFKIESSAHHIQGLTCKLLRDLTENS